MKKKHLLIDQGGFTLVEIIAVLIILAIIAAVAVPKYLDIASDAQQSAVDAALSEASARYNRAYATYYLQSAQDPPDCSDLSLDPDLVDFTAQWCGDGTHVTITITAGPDWFPGSTTATKLIPGTCSGCN